jgi:predicted metallo-beta-lactamase superfamily hydrolase
MSDVGLRFVLSENPSAIIVGGPPTYLAGSKVSDTSVTKGLDNLCVLAKSVPLVIVDHHMLRAQQALEELDKIAAQVRPLNHLIMTASQYVGRQPLLLEANRRSLYEQEPPSNRFVKWTKLKEERLRLVKPPVESKRRKRGEVSGRR